jgi:hypothetical protein
MSTPADVAAKDVTANDGSANDGSAPAVRLPPEIPFHDEIITLKHGSGGLAMRRLIESVLVPGLAETNGHWFGLQALDDGAAIRLGDDWLVMTTDSHVIHPVFFPGGDIGRLAVAGTVNDLAASHAPSSWRKGSPCRSCGRSRPRSSRRAGMRTSPS